MMSQIVTSVTVRTVTVTFNIHHTVILMITLFRNVSMKSPLFRVESLDYDTNIFSNKNYEHKIIILSHKIILYVSHIGYIALKM